MSNLDFARENWSVKQGSFNLSKFLIAIKQSPEHSKSNHKHFVKLSSHASQESLLQYPWVQTVLVMRITTLIVHCFLEESQECLSKVLVPQSCEPLVVHQERA